MPHCTISIGRKDIASNLILLCSFCHEEAPSFNLPNAEKLIWFWIKNTHKSFYGEFHSSKVLEEFKKLFHRNPNMNLISKLKLNRILTQYTGIHFGDRIISYSSYAIILYKSGD